MNPEREDRCLERRRVDLALREDSDERRGERGVLGEHEVLGLDPVGPLGLMVVEGDDVDARRPGDVGELAEALRVDGLDHDQPRDRVGVDPARIGHVELVRVQAVEVAHVPVQRAGEGDHGPGKEPASSKHGREGVEVGVRVGRDDVHGLKVRPETGALRGFGSVPQPDSPALAAARTGTPFARFKAPPTRFSAVG